MADKTEKSSLGDRIKLSIILKLNARLFFKMLMTFFALDILLCCTAALCTVIYAERSLAPVAQRVEKSGQPDSAGTEWLETQGITVKRLPESRMGFVIKQPMQGLLPQSTAGLQHNFTMPQDSRLTLFQRIDGAYYSLELNSDGRYYEVSFSLANASWSLEIFFITLFVIEALILLNSLSSHARIITRTLRPISELAQAAESLNDAAFSLENMESLAGELNSINAARLDTRIPVDKTQSELRTLAVAINNMLDRINEAYRSQIRFVSDASHELRTPIAVIQGYASLIDRWGKNDEKTLQESITAIKEETANMKQLVEQLLFLARGDNNTMRLAPETFDLSVLAGDVTDEMRMIDAGHEYEAILTPAVINADRQLIKQLMRILTDNAVKYTPSGGHIKVSVHSDGELALFTVQDDGIGIPDKAIPHIFDRFYRADESRARATGGSGLGLSIARWITERHGGHMEVLSRENIGTRISAALPLCGDKKQDEETLAAGTE